MTKETIEEYYRLKNLVKATRTDVEAIELFIRENIDPKARVCKKCTAQIRFYYQRIMYWGKSNIETLTDEEIENIDSKELLCESDSKIPDDTRKCVCGKEITGDRRYKKCVDCRNKVK